MKVYYIAIIIVIVILALFFIYLLKQSKNPTGIIGRYMINIWNKTYQPLFEYSLNKIAKNNIEKVLDIGIGGGYSTRYLSKIFVNAHIIGIDYSATAVEQARIINKDNIEFGSVGIIQGDATNLGLKRNDFDLVTAFQTHFHWSDFEKGLREIYKVLKKDGQLIISCEENKLKYHLKDYSNFEQVQTLAYKVGYSKIIHYQENGYVCYIMTK